MANVDIPIPEGLREALTAPACADLSLPPPQRLSVMLPSGAALTALANAGQNIPNDCSLTFSLMMQIMPLLGSMECVLKILKLLKPLSDAVTKFPPSPALIKDIGEAVVDLAPCFLMLTPAGMIPFVRDVLCLVLKVLSCLIGQLRTFSEFLRGISLHLVDARRQGNLELIATLECAQQNAMSAMAHSMQGIEPITALMDLAGPFLSIAGVSAIKMPALGSVEDQEALDKAINTLDDVVSTVRKIVDSLGGCPT
jgi:hypothetical protein